MLSSAKIGRSSWRYYQRTVAGGACEYYAEHGDAPGRWHGAGLTQLGLVAGAEVAEQELEALFGRALSPTTGVALGSGWRSDAVTGYDLTFSAPKSVSTLWALADSRMMAEIDAAHTAAVNAALRYLETHASLSRRGRDGVEQIGSAGFTAACFDHRTSRTGDPQLHTHALVVNKVRCTDGVWRTLDGHEIYHHKKSAGVLYQTALRAELSSRLAVSFGPVSEHGQAEIAGVPEALLAAWSSRTSAVLADAVPTIAAAEDALGRPVSAAERARIIKTAVLSTRPAKDAPVPEGDRRTRWAAQAAGLGFATDTVTDSVATADAQARARAVPAGWAQAVVTDSVTDVGRRKAIWSRADLSVAVAARIPTTGVPGLASAEDAVAWVEELTDTALTHVNLSGAVALGVDPSGVTARASDARFASRELVETEARIVERTIGGGFVPAKFLRPEVLLEFFTGPAATLSVEQRRAAVRLVASRDLVTVMTAPAGAGKTTTLAAAIAVWSGQDTDVIALAPSARAASELTAATGAPGQTVARWLLAEANDPAPVRRPRDRGYYPRQVIIVDEASMLTTSDLDRLTHYADTHQARLVLVGDPGQIGAVNAPGGMFEHLTVKLAGQVVELTELHRFTHAWEAAATLRLRAGDPGVLDTYAERGRVHPAASSEDAADAVFDRWQRTTDTGADALMLARAWADVNALNARARAVAIATGTVTGPDLATIATRSASTRGQVEERSWRAGDVILAKKNNTRIPVGAQTLRNGDRFRVLASDAAGGLIVSDLAGRGTVTLPGAYLARHAEYGWAATIDGAQGATTDIGIVLARSGLDREHLYVAMSRGRSENHVHTTPELATGDAGPHRNVVAPIETHRDLGPDQVPYQGPLAAGLAVDGKDSRPGSQQHLQTPARGATRSATEGQLLLPDVDAALALLARAVATSGRERAAHALLDPAVHAARETAWASQEIARVPQIPSEHQRHRDALDAARASRDAHADRVTHLRTELDTQRGALERVPFWARTRRFTSTKAVHRAEGDLDRAVAWLATEDTTLTRLMAVVDTDTTQRGIDEDLARHRRYNTWAAWGTTVMDDPNLHTGKDDPRLQLARLAWTPDPFTVDHDPPHHTPSYDSGRDYHGRENDRGYGIDR